jgi:hypothetical protein
MALKINSLFASARVWTFNCVAEWRSAADQQ